MIKKEVICYSGFSMGGFEACELLENNKAKINALETSAEIIEIKEYKILTFWDKIEEIGVWKWNKKYPIKESKYEILDGYNWDLKLRDRNGRAKYCKGYEGYPEKFKDFIKELNYLFGSKIEF